MKKLGKCKLTDRVALMTDLGNLIKCVEKLPDPNDVLAGCICQLTGSQPGYTATHIYKVVKEEGTETPYWTDITGSDYIDVITGASASIWELDVDGSKLVAARWVTPVDPDNDYWSHSVLMRKVGSDPISPDDGEELVRSDTRDEYSSKLFLSGYLRDKESRYRYSLFHVYKSGVIKRMICEAGSETDPDFLALIAEISG